VKCILCGFELPHGRLRTCDKVWAIGQIGNNLTQLEIAQGCGFSQSYVGKLLTIYNKLDSFVLKLWRSEMIEIDYIKILKIAHRPRNQHLDLFLKLCRRKRRKRLNNKEKKYR
jgi:hypothetical protein